jgi:hypothetical protein
MGDTVDDECVNVKAPMGSFYFILSELILLTVNFTDFIQNFYITTQARHRAPCIITSHCSCFLLDSSQKHIVDSQVRQDTRSTQHEMRYMYTSRSFRETKIRSFCSFYLFCFFFSVSFFAVRKTKMLFFFVLSIFSGFFVLFLFSLIIQKKKRRKEKFRQPPMRREIRKRVSHLTKDTGESRQQQGAARVLHHAPTDPSISEGLPPSPNITQM